MDVIEKDEAKSMEECVDLLTTCILNKHSIYTFGASHAGILSEELYYRAGGLMLFNPIFGREIMLDTSPITLTSKMERCVGYGTILAQSKVNFKKDDVLIVHSVSGRNPVAIEIAAEAKKMGDTGRAKAAKSDALSDAALFEGDPHPAEHDQRGAGGGKFI